MARFGSLGTQYFDNSGEVLTAGYIQFYASGTSAPIDTYADVGLTIENAWPVPLDAAGRQPNVFFDGTAKATLRSSAGVMIATADPVGDTATSFGSTWSSALVYQENDVVIYDDNFYISIAANNQNHIPTGGSPWWQPYFDYLAKIQALVAAGYVAIGSAATGLASVNINAKGSLLVGNGTIPAALAASTNGLFLTLDSGEALGVKWAAVPEGPGDNAVILTTGNGFGSTNTKIRIYTTTLLNVGTAITYATSAAAGASLTINEDGLYFVGAWEGTSGGTAIMGASVNSNQLTTNIESITAADRLFGGYIPSIGVASAAAGGGVFEFAAGDVIRPHGNAANVLNSDVLTQFIIRKVAAL